MDVASIMSADPLTLSPEDTVDAALDRMQDEDIRHLPVMENDCLLGIVSDRDLLWLAHRPTAPGSPPHFQMQPGLLPVRDVMQTSPSTISPQDSVVTASVAFVVQKIGCLPVIEDDLLVGIVTEMDMLSAYVRAAQAGQFTDAADLPDVATLMTADPQGVPSATPIAEAVRRCHEIHARHLLVVDDGKLSGIVSDRDFRRSLASGRSELSHVVDIMEREPLSLAPGSPATEAAELMVRGKISALPVLNGDQVVGILTLTDLLDHCMNTLRDPETSPQGG
jgi:CBS domain-containing protein